MSTPWLSVVIPVRNEAGRLEQTLRPLQPWRARGVEVLVVDGDSSDASAREASEWADQVLTSSPGRARQMNLGAGHARAPLLWFLHADSTISDRHLAALRELADTPCWGRFDVRLSAGGLTLWLVATGMNLRSRLTGVATGDQGIFVHESLFWQAGGYPDQPLMEDVALTDRLRRLAPPRCLREPLVTDSRRWERHGRWKTIMLMWWLRFRYWRGDSPEALHRCYYETEGRELK